MDKGIREISEDFTSVKVGMGTPSSSSALTTLSLKDGELVIKIAKSAPKIRGSII